MIARQKWVDHKFNLGIDVGWTQNILIRLQDAPIRIQYHNKELSDEQLSLRLNSKWSIKEHIGHLIDLEELHTNRLHEFATHKENLSPADMTNLKTNEANHNEQSIVVLLDKFRAERAKLIKIFKSLSIETQNHRAMHPRIKVLMRPVDLLFFVAEHDDHHLVSITEIKNTYN